MIRYPRTCCFQVRFGTLLVGPVTLFFSHHSKLSINVKVLVSFTRKKNNFVVCDVSLQGLTKRSDRFETIKLYRIRVSRKIDFAKYPLVINLLRHKI